MKMFSSKFQKFISVLLLSCFLFPILISFGDEGGAEGEGLSVSEAEGEVSEEKTEIIDTAPIALGMSSDTVPLALGMSSFALPLSANEAIVYNYNELRDALSVNNGITKVYFGANIEMQGGITVNTSKTDIEISGIDPEGNGPYTLTDYNSTAQANTIRIPSGTSLTSLLVKDLNIVGKNYYGSISVVDNSNTASLTITYERVNYDGPEFGYHRQGTIRVIDCSIRLHSGNGVSPTQEFAEVKNLIFEGNNTIYAETSTTSVFWHVAGGNFTILDDSSVTLIAPNLSAYGVFYTDGTAYNVNISIGKGASFNIEEAYRPLTYTGASIGSVTVGEGGAFYVNVTRSGDYVMRVTNDVLIGKDATFHVITSQSYTALLQLGSGSGLKCDDPASVLLYSPNGRLIQSETSTCNLSINAQQINYWTAAGNGTIDNWPLYHWINTSGNVHISARVGTTGATSNIIYNYVGSQSPPGSISFSMNSARVLSCGRFELAVAEYDASLAKITGTTSPGEAVVRVSYVDSGGASGSLPDVTADEDDSFSVSLSRVTFDPDMAFTVRSAFQYLFAEAPAAVKYSHTVVVECVDTNGMPLGVLSVYSMTNGTSFTPSIPSFPEYTLKDWKLNDVAQGNIIVTIDSVTGPNKITLIYAKWAYIVSVDLDSSINWSDFGGNVAVTFSRGSSTQTAIFNPGLLEYTGYPETSAEKGIIPLDAGSWSVNLNLPCNYSYEVFVDNVSAGTGPVTITAANQYNCEIEIVITQRSISIPWGKHIFRFL